ncbi:MAG TPA: PEGA domain-containing protein [Vicinamibacterales bacterium]|jgi:PEGA domain-containing protein|nr:PEGA domain-containing protein [Vicinamibacterales bacterium]
MDTPPESPVSSDNRIEPPHDEPRERDPRFSVMATAAGTSALVSLLTLWLWTPTPPRAADANGTVSVTYELLDQERGRDGTDDATTRDPVAGAIGANGQSVVVPVSHTAAAPLERSTDGEDAPSSSRIRIITQPEGAGVTINGVGYGTTPLDIPYLPPGAKRIRVTKAGYEAEERFFSSDVGRASSLRITLRETKIARSSTR